MKIKFYSIEKMNEFRTTSVASGCRIAYDVKVDYATAKHIGFSCSDKKSDTTHSVIYFSEREFPDSWNCDCKWSSLKRSMCKHIFAVFFRLNQDNNFLKKFEKEKISQAKT